MINKIVSEYLANINGKAFRIAVTDDGKVYAIAPNNWLTLEHREHFRQYFNISEDESIELIVYMENVIAARTKIFLNKECMIS